MPDFTPPPPRAACLCCTTTVQNTTLQGCFAAIRVAACFARCCTHPVASQPSRICVCDMLRATTAAHTWATKVLLASSYPPTRPRAEPAANQQHCCQQHRLTHRTLCIPHHQTTITHMYPHHATHPEHPPPNPPCSVCLRMFLIPQSQPHAAAF